MAEPESDTSVALALAILKPAVEAGIFSPSRERSKKWRRFLLKFRLTSFENYTASSWDELAFQYDDTRVQVIVTKADAGDAEAAALLKEIAVAQLPNLPPKLAAYVRQLLQQDRPPKQRRGHPPEFIDRDICIYQTVEMMRRHGFLATRNAATDMDSGCSIVSAALQALGVPKMSEQNVMRIWQEVQSSIPVIANSQ